MTRVTGRAELVTCAVLLLCLAGCDASAQQSGTRSGVMTPSSGQPQGAPGDLVVRVVLIDTDKPITGVTISLDSTPIGTTDSTGKLHRTGIATGRHTVGLQRVGFRAFDFPATVRDDGTTTLELEMVGIAADASSAVTTLGTVEVTAAKSAPPPLSDFDRHRARGLGQFITRAQFDSAANHTVIDVLRRKTTARFTEMYGRISIASITQQPTGALVGVKNAGEISSRPCFSQVYRDGVRLWGMPGLDITGKNIETNPPPDLRDFITQDVESAEYYTGAGATPPEYRTDGAECGTLVIWLRKPR